MSEVWLIIKEQVANIRTIFRLSRYEEKATYQSHYLGLLWQILNPAIQIGIYYLVFGVGVNGKNLVDGVPFFGWMLIGMTAWFFINSSMLGGSNSIYRQVNVVSKMKFPLSILPTTNMVSNLSTFWPMTAITIIVLAIFGKYPTIYWTQLIYYFFCMIVLLFAFGVLNSTITVLVRDYHIMLQSVLRLLFYVSGTIWNIENRNLPVWLVKILKLNPFYYIIDGFRDGYLSKGWFWEKGTYGLIFWGMTLIILLVGCHLHLKFRSKFVDLV
ncbi:ABC transporter permease [Enterococcus diestrammenae]|uniref:Transport permease protein n=1 Tax=Enterococcus diestrammenae TaxID=1155073 RepID=A0ABV0EZF8_9ENTE|nr:ABC transporter permease [Enterococcus diestrammenae]KAF1294981.1 Teichoic acid translocation permease TagG [Enterococcus diestrammenae]